MVIDIMRYFIKIKISHDYRYHEIFLMVIDIVRYFNKIKKLMVIDIVYLTMRYYEFGVISHEIFNHEILWFWCNIS